MLPRRYRSEYVEVTPSYLNWKRQLEAKHPPWFVDKCLRGIPITKDDWCRRNTEVVMSANKTESLRPTDNLETQGVKFDNGKLRWSLIPWDSVRAILEILEIGARKYAARNWEQGMDWSRPFDACIRHLTSWYNGENKDPDTGKSHLWHAGCNIVFLIAYELRGVGKDDRPNRI